MAGCAQFTTNDEERAALDVTAESRAEAYLQCIKDESKQVLGISRDAAFIVDRAKGACSSELERYKSAKLELLATEYIKTDKELEEAVERIDDRSESAVAEMLMVSAANSAGATPVPAGPAPTVSAPQIPVPSDFEPSFDQRVYMDCMRDQAIKYVRLNETAAAISEVAASRCRPHLTGGNQAVLEQEGRTVVMGAVFDARLEAGDAARQSQSQ